MNIIAVTVCPILLSFVNNLSYIIYLLAWSIISSLLLEYSHRYIIIPVATERADIGVIDAPEAGYIIFDG